MAKRKLIVKNRTINKELIKQSDPNPTTDNKIASFIGVADLKKLKSTQLTTLEENVKKLWFVRFLLYYRE